MLESHSEETPLRQFEGADTLPVLFESNNPFSFPQSASISSSAGHQVTLEPIEPVSRAWADSSPEFVQALLGRNVEACLADLEDLPDNPSVLTNVGLAHLNAGRLEEAERFLRRVISIDANAIAARAALAKACVLLGRISDAVAEYTALLKCNPNHTAGLLNLAQLYVGLGQEGEAGELLERVLQLDPSNAAAHNNLGVLKVMRGEFAAAIAEFRRSLRENGRQPNVHNNLGACYVVLGSRRKAERAFRTALSIDPMNGGAIKNLAELFMQNNDPTGAGTILRSYVARGSYDWEAQVLLARAYFVQNRISDAKRELHAVLLKIGDQGAPEKLASVFNNLGVTYRVAKDWNRAYEYFTKSLEKDGDRQLVLHNCAVLLFEGERYESAVELLQRCLAKHPSDSFALTLLGLCHCRRGEYQLGRQEVERALVINPGEAAAYGPLTIILGEIEGNYAECARRLEIARELKPDNRLIMNNLAYCYLMIGYVDKARAVLDSLDETKDDMFLAATRGLLLLKEGNEAEARRLYNLAAKRARTATDRVLVLQKRDLECARRLFEGGDKAGALWLLKGVVKKQRKREPYYYDQAIKLLDRIEQQG